MQFGVSESIAHWGKYRPSACAIVQGNKEISFGELNRCAEQVACAVSAGTVGVERVGVAIKSKYQFLIGLLGVLRAGKSAVILNTGVPDDVLAMNMNDADVGVVIHDALNKKCKVLRAGSRSRVLFKAAAMERLRAGSER